ncbi:MAG: cold shock domain-containing protein [Melioribacteraceae bacterium]|nr:cold shock domain-containing protein [Melioribacteraceae bacterium]MCF8353405.1 cold shock domain-containing protein [Melioribacteraceae bacterium]MCF8393016.1 cold shock domain-containing protein [Melioribacteraceae bacterium]MCF8419131.1 cold shock domain-containing protein [Melioribacteraceae bacterium]
MNEPLDFCRVKNINEKGYGFLKSLYYPGDIFFHFSQIKKEDFLDKLNDLKRGAFFLYYTSKAQKDGRRKVSALWYSIEAVPKILIPEFSERIIREFNEGNTNLYDLIYVFDQLKKNLLISETQIHDVLASNKIRRLPTTILTSLDDNEIKKLGEILNIDQLKRSNDPPFWLEDFPGV